MPLMTPRAPHELGPEAQLGRRGRQPPRMAGVDQTEDWTEPVHGKRLGCRAGLGREAALSWVSRASHRRNRLAPRLQSGSFAE